jgi:GNAT superfamily N-acetyltransferase
VGLKRHGQQIGLLQICTDSGSCYVAAVDVLPDWQRMGIATALYSRAKQVLESFGFEEVSGCIEGAGVVSIREAVFGPGATHYRCGEADVSPEVARQIVEQDYQRVIARTTLCLLTPSKL